MCYRVPSKVVLITTVLAAVLTAGAARASAISFSGAVTSIAAPADAQLHSLESDTLAPLFSEVSNFVLASPLLVDITTTGTFDTVASLTPGSVAAGTAVDSYYLLTDPVGAPTTFSRRYLGSITFSTDILGIVALNTYATSDPIVGHPGTLYTNHAGIAIDFGVPDVLVLSADRRTVSFDLTSGPGADNFRVITAATPVPEPASMLLLVSGLVGGAARMRRRRTLAVTGRLKRDSTQ